MIRRALWKLTTGDCPVAAAAIHDGHEMREEVAAQYGVGEKERLREEDPYTGIWAEVADTRIVVKTSRFEMDLNRPREKAVYINPEDAWGLRVWEKRPPDSLVAASLAQYDAFYAMARDVLSALEERFGHFVVLDLHTYNHRRGGPDAAPADPKENPEVNIGTGTMDRSRWGPIADRFMDDLRKFDFLGRHLDVRENIKFQGGNFSRWIHQSFPDSGCALAIEFKKFFIDEWTEKVDPAQLDAIRRALQSTLPGLLEELKRLKPES